MELCVLGTNHERAGVELRERLAFNEDALAAGLRDMRAFAAEGAILSTCNRTEIYALVDGDGIGSLRRFLSMSRDVPERELDGALYAHTQHDAVRHVFRVACGLDSMLLGEAQILAQAGRAFETARVAGAAGPVLSRLGMHAARAGKRARTLTGIARNRGSMAHAAVDLAARELGGLRGRSALVVGAGEMATLAARVLRYAGVEQLIVANRGAARGEALARDTGGRYLPLEDLPVALAHVDAVIAATAAPGHALTPPMLNGRTAPLVAVDLGVPRCIDSALAQHPAVRLYTVDDLEQVAAGNRARVAQDAERAEALVATAVDEFFDWWRGRAAAPAISNIYAHAAELRERELERALRKLGHLSERDRAVVAALADGIVGKLLHAPITHLRETPEDGEAALRVFGVASSGPHPPTPSPNSGRGGAGRC